jgi:hypothetical protein
LGNVKGRDRLEYLSIEDRIRKKVKFTLEQAMKVQIGR